MYCQVSLFNFFITQTAQARVSAILEWMKSRMIERQRLGGVYSQETLTKMKQARMNILVLLLRLRQAVCHPVEKKWRENNDD
jgi:hypothetical protein